jgi:hypothetical protein
MRKARTTLTTVLAIGLLTGSAIGVAAQETETEAPTEFTAFWDSNFGPPGVRPGATSAPTRCAAVATPTILASSRQPATPVSRVR